MREWNLTNCDPLQLILAADGQLTDLDYTNDQIWELSLAGGEPAALTLQTSFGLRARSMRLFSQFHSHDISLSDPQSFFRPPVIRRMYPNFIELEFSPFSGVEIHYEIWVPSSHALAGRLTFFNQNAEPVDFGFEWNAVLNPLGSDGSSISVTQIGINNVLSGASENLQPVGFMTGGPAPNFSPLPGLSLKIELEPDAARQITWSLASLGNAQESYDLARLTTARDWEAEKARIELLNASRQVKIHTGNTDWDAALAVSQKAAASLVFSPGGDLPNPSFVLARTPEQGYSLRGDGSDYTHLWNGQTALDAWYLSSLLLPGMEVYLAGLIDNFITVQQHNGAIDWKPGMAGQRSKRLAQPLLATLAWRVYEHLMDVTWLEHIYPRLLSFINAWFQPQHDSDQDGYPEWLHPFQIGLDSIPLFHPWQAGSQGVDPHVVESPSLAAFLYRECLSLSQMAAILNKTEDLAWLDATSARLREMVEEQWDSIGSCYTYWDAVTHRSTSGVRLLEIRGPVVAKIESAIEPAQRLLLRIKTCDEGTRNTHMIIRGETLEGAESEEIHPRQIRWLYGEGRYSTRDHFSRVDEIVISHGEPGDVCTVDTVDLSTSDISLLLPLWAEIPSAERARILVEKTIFQEYMQPYGLPVCPPRLQPGLDETTQMVSLPWNQMVVEGMLTYGFRREAAMLLERAMQAVILNLKSTHQFSAFYHAETGCGNNDRGSLHGMAPVGLFLKTLGLQLLTPNKVIVEGFNPFPWPINVQYRGTKLIFEENSTRIELPDGQIISIADPKQYVVALP